MKFALPFSNSYKDLKSTEIQWIINYKPQIDKLNNFIQEFQNYRIICKFESDPTDKDIEILNILTKKFKNSKIIAAIPYYTQEIEQKFNNNEILHYYQRPVNTWEDFSGCINLNVTDILITEGLCFSLPTVKKRAAEKNILVRSYCNVCENEWNSLPSYKSFFVRPDDIDLYNNYIDVFEFYDEKEPQKIKTLYEIYHNDKKWFGLLKQLIKNYKGDEDNKTLVSVFTEKRIKCDHKCFKNDFCKICDNIVTLGKTLDKKSLYIKE